MTAAVAVFWSLMCVGVAALQYQRVRASRVEGLDRLVRGGERTDLAQLAARAAELTGEGPDVARLRDALGQGDRAHVVAGLNELLTDVGGAMGRMEVVPGAAARVALFGGFLLAVIEVARGLQGGTTDGRLLVVTLAAGGSGALGCSLIGRASARLAAQQRDLWNRLSRAAGR